ncbi:MAG: hypothetical protein ABIG68_07505, partial [Acidobacteriota bacterium]
HLIGSRGFNLYFAGNLLAVYAVVRETGGRDSMFWPAFFLPVLSASLARNGEKPWRAVALSGGLLGVSYLSPAPEIFGALEWCVKVATLAFAAAVTHRTSAREFSVRRSVEEKRFHLEYLAMRMIQEHQPIETKGDIREQIETRVRMLENPLSILEDSTRLVRMVNPDSQADIKRIEACQKIIRAITQDLFDIVHHDEFWKEPCSFEEIYRKVLTDLRYPLAVKEIRWVEMIDPCLPQIPMSRPHIEQFLQSVIGDAALTSGHRETFTAEANIAGVNEEPYMEFIFQHPGLANAVALPQLKRIAERHGGWLRLEYRTRTVRLILALPLYASGRLQPPPDDSAKR